MTGNKMITLEGIRTVAKQSKSYTDRKISELQERFDLLGDEYHIYKSVDNSDSTAITDSTGEPVMGKLVYALK